MDFGRFLSSFKICHKICQFSNCFKQICRKNLFKCCSVSTIILSITFCQKPYNSTVDKITQPIGGIGIKRFANSIPTLMPTKNIYETKAKLNVINAVDFVFVLVGG